MVTSATSAASAIVVIIVVVIIISIASVAAEYGQEADQPGVVKDRIPVVKIPIPVIVSTVTHNRFLQFFQCGGFSIRTSSYVGACRNVSNCDRLR